MRLWVIVSILLVAALFALSVLTTSRRDGPGFFAHMTRSALRSVALATRAYHSEQQTWPKSLNQLTNAVPPLIDTTDFMIGEGTLCDSWGHPIQYEPFNAVKGYGVVSSFGKDGKLGGTRYDSDIEFRFTSTNVWEHQQVPPTLRR